jgi:hypothetical protein
MTKEELKDKFRELTKGVLTDNHTENIIRTVSRLEELDNLQEMCVLLASDQ